MAKNQFSFEFRIVLIILLTVVIVGGTGFLAYRNMRSIVGYISEEAKPDVKLAMLKEILGDLSDAESSVKSYSITNDDQYLLPFYIAASSIDRKIDSLEYLSRSEEKQQPVIDSIKILVEEKFSILKQLLTMQENNRVEAALEKISRKLSTPADTVEKKKAVIAEQEDGKKKSSIFRKIFGKKKKEEEKPVQPVKPLKPEETIQEAKQEIKKIKKQEAKHSEKWKATQLELTEKDKEIMDKIRMLVLQLEDMEILAIAEKTKEAEQVTARTNRWIAAFCGTASLLLFIVSYVVVSYVRKNRAYNIVLKEAKAEAETLAKAKENFLSTMSHEIRTPMNAIAGFTEQVLKSRLDKDQKSQLTVVQKSVDHLLKILNDILDFSKLEAGKIELEETGFRTEEVCEEVSALIKYQAAKKDIRISYQLEKSIPPVLIGDPGRLRQILLNIVSNAVKFTEKGEIRMEAGAELHDKENALLTFRITDTGIGIAGDKVKNIFNEFEQADTGITRKYGGTGLGLAITKKLVELQNGNIEIQSKPDKGTTVIFTIPYRTGTIGDLRQEEEKNISYEQFREKKMLIAEDDEYNIRLLEAILNKYGIRFTTVNNGEEVLKELQKNRYDAILMDVRMPVINGFDTTRMIRRQLRSDIPVIAITATANREDMERCKEAGMNEFLSKPFKEIELFKKFLNVFEGKKAAGHETQNIYPANNIKIQEAMTPSYKLDELYHLASGDEKFVTEMLEVFIKTTEEGVTRIKEGITNQSWERVADSAHKIAAPCIHMDALSVVKLLQDIEGKAREKRQVEEIPSLARQLEDEAQHLINDLRKEVSKRKR